MKVKELLEILKTASPDEHVLVKVPGGYDEVIEATRHSLPGSWIADLILYTERP